MDWVTTFTVNHYFFLIYCNSHAIKLFSLSKYIEKILAYTGKFNAISMNKNKEWTPVYNTASIWQTEIQLNPCMDAILHFTHAQDEIQQVSAFSDHRNEILNCLHLKVWILLSITILLMHWHSTKSLVWFWVNDNAIKILYQTNNTVFQNRFPIKYI